MINFSDFEKVDIRVGRIIEVEDFPEAKKPAYKLKVDLGKDIGIKRSSAQVVKKYSKEHLLNKLVLCVVNFPPKQIGSFISEVLVLGVPDQDNECILIHPDRKVPTGGKLY